MTVVTILYSPGHSASSGSGPAVRLQMWRSAYGKKTMWDTPYGWDVRWQTVNTVPLPKRLLTGCAYTTPFRTPQHNAIANNMWWDSLPLLRGIQVVSSWYACDGWMINTTSLNALCIFEYWTPQTSYRKCHHPSSLHDPSPKTEHAHTCHKQTNVLNIYMTCMHDVAPVSFSCWAFPSLLPLRSLLELCTYMYAYHTCHKWSRYIIPCNEG